MHLRPITASYTHNLLISQSDRFMQQTIKLQISNLCSCVKFISVCYLYDLTINKNDRMQLKLLQTRAG